MYGVKYFVYIIQYSISEYLKLYYVPTKKKEVLTLTSQFYIVVFYGYHWFCCFFFYTPIFMLFNSHTNHEPIEHHLIEIMNEPIVYGEPWTLDQFVGQYRCIYVYIVNILYT